MSIGLIWGNEKRVSDNSAKSDVKNNGKKWTKAEEQYLIENYGVEDFDVVIEKLGRSKSSLTKKARLLRSCGFEVGNYKINSSYRDDLWSEEEINYLIENYGVLYIEVIIRKLGRTESAIRTVVTRLKQSGEDIIGYKGISKKQEKYLRENYKNKTVKQLSKDMGITERKIQYQVKTLGLRKYKK